VLWEDLGALIGLVLALVGVSVATITGDGRFDGWGSMAIDDAEARVRAAVPVTCMIYLEPDIDRNK
jgi:hypothetical protein